jgi:class 3 adenylate cyclase
VHLFGARHMQFIGEGLLAVFVDTTDTHSVNHALRAARAALGLVESGNAIRQYMQTQYPGRELPRFDVTVALHSGAVTLTLLQDPLHGGPPQVLPVGDAVSAAMLLQKQGHAMGWPIAASVTVLRGITGAVKTGRRAMVELPGRSAPMDAAELVGLAA